MNFKRKLILGLIDAIIAMVAGIITAHILYDTAVIFSYTQFLLYSTIVAVIAQTLSMLVTNVYKSLVRYADVYLNIKLVFACCISFLLQVVVQGSLLTNYSVGCLYAFIQVVMAFMAIITTRFIYQYFVNVYMLKNNKLGQRVMIIGAGWTGRRIVTDLSREKHRYNAVCLIDDDKELIGQFIEDVPIVGSSKTIKYNVKKFKVNKILVALPSVDNNIKKDIIAKCIETGVEVNVLPELADLVTTSPNLVNQAREVKIEDLLERDVIKFDPNDISNLINGKVCLITGGGGSIGSELSRQIANNKPKKLVLCDIYENSAFSIGCELREKFVDNLDLEIEIVSITDYKAMDKLFKKYKFDLVFHAAAHKHVPLMEHNPEESVKNNINGTYNIAKLAKIYKVQKFVMVSTDKAVNPTNVMGATKRFCEKIVNYFDSQTEDTNYCVVRFGNVLGSNGSVLHIFNKQIDNGGPVTVTHPDIIRFFMTIPEAVSLILQAGAFAKGGEVFVLDMGQPVKILNLAESLIKLRGKEPYKEIKIEFTGLRPGEKLFEELLMSEEGLKKTENDKIYIGNQSFVREQNVKDLYLELIKVANTNDSQETVNALIKAVPTYSPDERYFEVDKKQQVD